MPKNKEMKKKNEIHQRQALWTSFDILVVTCRVTCLPKLVDMLLLSTEKTEFPFLEFPYFRVLPEKAKHLCQIQAHAAEASHTAYSVKY